MKPSIQGLEEEKPLRLYDSALLKRLFRYARPYWRSLLVALALLLVGSALQIVGPLLTKLAVDRYLVPTGAPTFLDPYLPEDPWRGLSLISGLYLVVILLGLLAAFAEGYLMEFVGQRAMFDLRHQLMQKLHQLDIAFFDRNPVGRLVTRVTTDVDVLNELFSSGIVMIAGDLLVLSLVLVAMLKLSVGLTLILLLITPLVVFCTLLFRKQAGHGYRRTRIAIARINAFLQEHLSGISVVHLFNREEKAFKGFEQHNREYLKAFKDTIFAYAWFYPVVEFLAMLALAAMLAYGGYQITQGETTLGVLVAFFQYGMRFFRPVQDLSEKYNILQSAMAAAERIFALLDEPVHVTSPPEPKKLPDGPLAIEFDHVWFAYKDQQWVIRDVAFRIEPGETIAVVGHTGAGKSTLINLLLRFYDVQRGSIRIGGIDIRELDPKELRKQFGVVLQEPHIFSGTIEENIRLGNRDLSYDQILAAAEQANLMELIQSLPEGLRHPIHERGEGLSTGQKQLINFARALAHNPRFLILDEATANVDTDTELKIREAMQRLMKGRTCIVIAHRLSTIQQASRIFVMHRGELREVGTHQELLARRGVYWHLYMLQYRDQEQETALADHSLEQIVREQLQ